MNTRRWIYAAVGTTVVVIAGVVIFAVLRDADTEDAFLAGYRTTDDPRVIVVVATVGPRDEILGSNVRERGNQIVITVTVRTPSGTGNSSAVERDVTVRLAQPLADREIIASDGRRLSPVPPRP